MLSVILYGRNDNHGYNLHKRAAISLNAIAHLLDDPADEIIFVDYNTPDDLPAFLEAIADTLTDKALAKIRVLRVRSDVHQEHFAGRTHLNALEPIARNVAIRRANPANKWVLSTNTDMIFCPVDAAASLTSIIGGLDDGYYHLPRFELPEALWETLDRKDGPGLIAAAREWGERFHLNEIVHSAGDHLFDGPGDFQLFLREDLDRIGGFHEEMILGWHLDANVARRMHLLRGKVSSALDHLVGYHCDHTRQASAYHKADRMENDPSRFVDKVETPQIPEQMQTWGLPDEDIEEFRLGQGSGARYLKGLEAAVPGRLTGFLEAAYVPDAYGQLSYNSDHVLPYLLDLVSCIPQDSVIGYVGARRDLFEGLARGWAAMGGSRPIAVPDTAPWLAHPNARTVPLADWAQQADVFIFEVGAENSQDQGHLTQEDSVRLWTVDQTFKHAAAADFERQLAGAAARRAFVVNGIHNFFEPQVFRAISASLTPFSTRIRHGYIADRSRGRLAASSPAQRRVAAQLGTPLSLIEQTRIADLVASLDANRPSNWTGAAKLTAEIVALAAQDLVRNPHMPDVMERLTELRPSRRIGNQLVSPAAGRDAPNRLARLEDWDDPQWVALAGWLYGTVDHTSLWTRELWMWERVTLTQNLLKDIPLGSDAKILLAGRLAEAHAFALAQLGFEVDIIDPASLANGTLAAEDWRERYAHDGWVSRTPIGLASDRSDAIARGFRYDAVILPQSGAFILGRSRGADVLRGAANLLRPGGHLGFAVVSQVVSVDDRILEDSLPVSLLRGGQLAKEIDAHTELALQGAVDDRLTPRTIDRNDEGGCPVPVLVRGALTQLQTSAVFAFRRRDGAQGNWGRVARLLLSGGVGGAATTSDAATVISASASAFTFADIEDLPPSAEDLARFGSLMDRTVLAKEWVRRTPMGLEMRLRSEPRVALHMDVGRLSAGGYELVVELYLPPEAPADAVLALGLICGDRVVAEHRIDGALSGPRVVDFYFELDETVADKGLRLAVKALGGDFDVLGLKLR